MESATTPVLTPPAGSVLDVKPEGVRLELVLDSQRPLVHLSLSVRAASAAEETLAIRPQSDAGALEGGKSVRWISADWPGERALVALRLTAVSEKGNDAGAGLRVRIGSLGRWQPLLPLDTFNLTAPPKSTESEAVARFPAVAAGRIMLETLVENKVGKQLTGVLVPGPVQAKNLSLTVTQQPCHVSVALGDDPAFFTLPGPLPDVRVEIEGLARAVGRYRIDNPGTPKIPIVVRSANPAQLLLVAFEGQQPLPEPAAPPKIPMGQPDEKQRVEQTFCGSSAIPAEASALDPALPEQSTSTSADGTEAKETQETKETQKIQEEKENKEQQQEETQQHQGKQALTAHPKALHARLCTPQYAAAQCFTPLPAGQGLSSVSLYLSLANHAQCHWGLHTDDHGRPSSAPALAGPLDGVPAPGPTIPTWVTVSLKELWCPPEGNNWWLLLHVTAGQALWHTDATMPPVAGPAVYRCGQRGSWMPVVVGTVPHWLQSQVFTAALPTKA